MLEKLKKLVLNKYLGVVIRKGLDYVGVGLVLLGERLVALGLDKEQVGALVAALLKAVEAANPLATGLGMLLVSLLWSLVDKKKNGK